MTDTENNPVVAAPKVSVLIPVYNREAVLRETIDSVLAQTFTDFELILCDDCSTDHSLEIMESYDDPRIRLLRNETNMGSSATRNRLFAGARGEYCAILDSDDVAYDYRLQIQVDFLDSHPQVDVCSGGVTVIDGRSESWGYSIHVESIKHEKIKVLTLFGCAVPQTALMFRRENFLAAGAKCVAGPANDMGLYRDAVHKLRFEQIDVPLVKYRVWDSQISSNEKGKQSDYAIKHLIYTYDKYLGMQLDLRDKELLRTMAYRGRIRSGMLRDFRNLGLRMLEANRKTRVFDQQELASHIKSVYTTCLNRKSGPTYVWFALPYKRFEKRVERLLFRNE